MGKAKDWTVCKYLLGVVAPVAGWCLSRDQAVASRLLQEIGFAAIYLSRAPRQPAPAPWGGCVCRGLLPRTVGCRRGLRLPCCSWESQNIST